MVRGQYIIAFVQPQSIFSTAQILLSLQLHPRLLLPHLQSQTGGSAREMTPDSAKELRKQRGTVLKGREGAVRQSASHDIMQLFHEFSNDVVVR